MRLFLAINLPPDVRRAVERSTEGLRTAAPQVSWVREPLIHLTLKFLGAQPPEVVEQVQSLLGDVGSRNRELAMTLESIGAFPNFHRARVVWMGVAPDPRLELLHHDIEAGCERLGFELDGRPFRPHITLARVKQRLDDGVARALARAAKTVDFHADFIVRSIDLMTSELSPAGPSYRTLVSVPLRSG